MGLKRYRDGLKSLLRDSAAVTLARAGASVVVLEAAGAIGGGTRTAELTLPGFVHDVCSAVHPFAVVSPFFQSLPLAAHGVEWISPPDRDTVWRRFGVIVTADCDVAHRKHRGVLSFCPIVRLEDYIRLFWLPDQLKDQELSLRRRLSEEIASLQKLEKRL